MEWNIAFHLVGILLLVLLPFFLILGVLAACVAALTVFAYRVGIKTQRPIWNRCVVVRACDSPRK